MLLGRAHSLLLFLFSTAEPTTICVRWSIRPLVRLVWLSLPFSLDNQKVFSSNAAHFSLDIQTPSFFALSTVPSVFAVTTPFPTYFILLRRAFSFFQVSSSLPSPPSSPYHPPTARLRSTRDGCRARQDPPPTVAPISISIIARELPASFRMRATNGSRECFRLRYSRLVGATYLDASILSDLVFIGGRILFVPSPSTRPLGSTRLPARDSSAAKNHGVIFVPLRPANARSLPAASLIGSGANLPRSVIPRSGSRFKPSTCFDFTPRAAEKFTSAACRFRLIREPEKTERNGGASSSDGK